MKGRVILNIISKLREEEFRTLIFAIISGIFLAISFFGKFSNQILDPAWFAIILCGTPIVYGAIKGLVKAFDVTADVLVAIALIAALFIGEYFAAGEVAFIMQIGKVLEDYTAGKSSKSLNALIKLTPQKATRRTELGEEEILATQLEKGDILLVRPGQAIPVDGKVIRGSTSVNQAVMTGESVPVYRTAGDEVYQGTINLEGVIDIEATHVGEDSSLKKMIRLVEEAENNQAPIVRIADRWARILVPVALGCAVLIYILTKDIYRAVTALVVFCPCSLILATPTAMVAAIGNATKKGILIKSGAAVEALGKIDTLVMDKTGTLTYGNLEVEEIHIFDSDSDRNKVISMIASAEKFSEHPIGKAVTKYSENLGIKVKDPEDFKIHIGKGVVAQVDGHEIFIGEKVIEQEIINKEKNTYDLMKQMQDKGKTVLPFSIDGRVVGIITITDMIRIDAKKSIEEIRKYGELNIVMMTGDNLAVANSIAQVAGITDIHASLLPEDKVNLIKKLNTEGHKVGMLGDGVNDAPALATASIGIVMGAIGSDVAIETADIALMGDEIGKLPFLLELSQKTNRRIIANIVLSMIINFGSIILAGFGLLTPVTAALVHNFGSVFVVLNSSLLLKYNGIKKPKEEMEVYL